MPTYINDADLSSEYATSIEIRGPPANNSMESVLTNATLENATLQAENGVLEETAGDVQAEGIILPGLHLVDPSVNYFDGQIIYLDFDGAEDVTYDGPVVVEGIDIPGFSAEAAGLAGQESAVISQILSALEQDFDGAGVCFTITRPDVGTEYSTIYIGGNDAAFAEYGSFLGLAEKVDVGNQDPCDVAFVFSDILIGGHSTIESLTTNLVNIVAHEIGHLLGYEHTNSTSNGLLDRLAAIGPQQVISTQANGAYSVYACDLDADGDNDILSASVNDDKIAWYENLGSGTFGTQQVISTLADGAASVYACDLDGDGDNDVLLASYHADKIAWYENFGGGIFGSEQVISTQTVESRSVYACDLDGDGDNDVLSASAYDDKIAWYENLGGGTFGGQQVISTQADGAFSVYTCDLDGDGDNDVLSASYLDDKIAWYENQGGGTFGNQQVITTQADGARSVYACDLDGDGDNDVLSASHDDDKIAWYENLIWAPGGSPEIDVERNGTDNVHAHSFGVLDIDQSVSQEFTVRNEGDAVLVVSQTAGLVGPFSINPLNNSGTTDNWVIPSGGIQTFTVSFSSYSPGNYSDTLFLTSNDSNEGSYQIDFTASATGAEIEVLGNGQVIVDGDTTPDSADHTDFGIVYVTGVSITRTFTINNTGSEDLNLTGSPYRVVITGSSDFTVTQQPASTVAAGGTTTFEVEFNASSYGTKTATVSIASNDYDENPYDFNIQAVGQLFGDQQIISTQANGARSVYSCDLDGDGDNDVIAAQWDKVAWYDNLGSGTFGGQQIISTQVNGAYSVYACDIDSDGDNDVLSASLYGNNITWYENLGSGTFGSQHVITTEAENAYSVYACDLDGDGDNDVLSASFSDNKIAWYENLVPSGGKPEIDVERDSTNDVHSHSFGSLQIGQTTSQVFTVRNEGNTDLVVIQATGLNSPFSISPANSVGSADDWVIPAGGTQTFTVSFSPVDEGNYSDILVLNSNDTDEGSYQISFTGNATGPEIEVIGNGQIIIDGDTTPTLSDHTDFGGAYVNSGLVTRTFTIRNTGSADLNLTGNPDRVVVTGSSDFTVTQQPASTIAAGGTTTFEVTFNPSVYQIQTATISIASNDFNENPYDFVIEGTFILFGGQQVISTQAGMPHSVYSCDLDGDGDNDVLSASFLDDKIAWYENQGGGIFSNQQIIDSPAKDAGAVYACDLDGDGDNDILSALLNGGEIVWYENLGGGTFGSRQIIDSPVQYARSIYACDLDGDGDNDVLSTFMYDDRIAWYENDGSGTFGSKQSISTQTDGAISVYACDLDGDGDNDVLSASNEDDKIAWYENLGSGTFGTQQVITTQADRASSVYACDLDGDGDNDVLSASFIDNKIAWYENQGGIFGSQQIITTQVDGAYSVYACDLDGDSDNDVLSISIYDNKIAWYENLKSPGVGPPEIDVELGGTDDIHAHSFGTL